LMCSRRSRLGPASNAGMPPHDATADNLHVPLTRSQTNGSSNRPHPVVPAEARMRGGLSATACFAGLPVIRAPSRNTAGHKEPSPAGRGTAPIIPIIWRLPDRSRERRQRLLQVDKWTCKFPRSLSIPLALLLAATSDFPSLQAQDPFGPQAAASRVELLRSTPLALPGQVDSNSPAFGIVAGRTRPVRDDVRQRHSEHRLRLLAEPTRSARRIAGWSHGRAAASGWNQSWLLRRHVVRLLPQRASGGRLRRRPEVIPRIGAAVSRDRGQTWEQLGSCSRRRATATTARQGTSTLCGGVGDISVQLDPTRGSLHLLL
jgi:hypothetical protein